MIGRADRLETQAGRRPLEGEGHRPLADALPAGAAGRRRRAARSATQDHGLERALDVELIARASRALERAAGRSRSQLPIRNVNRTVGHDARLRDHAPVRRRRAARRHDSHSASPARPGQSFGAFVPRGVTMTARGRLERLLGQGSLGRQDCACIRRARRRLPPRRTSSSATWRSTARRAARPTSAALPASGSRSGTAARSRSSKASAITAAST